MVSSYHCLSIRVDASPKSKRTRSTRMNMVSRKKRMSAGVVLLQRTQPNWCLATQVIFAMNDRADFASVAFQLLG